MCDSVSQTSLRPTSGIDIEPMNIGQVSEEKQQVVAVRPIFNMFQQTGGMGNFTIFRHKEMPRGVGITIWCNECFNGLLTLVDEPRGRIETLGAFRIKEEVVQPAGNTVPQNTFVLDPLMLDVNQVGVFMYKPPQALSIRGIADVFYFPEGFGRGDEMSTPLKHEVC